jgi:hypothetical protein
VKGATDPEVEDQVPVPVQEQEQEQVEVDMEIAEAMVIEVGLEDEVGMVIEVDTEDEVDMGDEVAMVMEAGADTEVEEDQHDHLLLDDTIHDHDHQFEDDPVLPLEGTFDEGRRTPDPATLAGAGAEVEVIRGAGVRVRRGGENRGASRGALVGVDQDQDRAHGVYHLKEDPSRRVGAGVGVQ